MDFNKCATLAEGGDYDRGFVESWKVLIVLSAWFCCDSETTL